MTGLTTRLSRARAGADLGDYCEIEGIDTIVVLGVPTTDPARASDADPAELLSEELRWR